VPVVGAVGQVAEEVVGVVDELRHRRG
jgi:hypothetical protein